MTELEAQWNECEKQPACDQCPYSRRRTKYFKHDMISSYYCDINYDYGIIPSNFKLERFKEIIKLKRLERL